MNPIPGTPTNSGPTNKLVDGSNTVTLENTGPTGEQLVCSAGVGIGQTAPFQTTVLVSESTGNVVLIYGAGAAQSIANGITSNATLPGLMLFVVETPGCLDMVIADDGPTQDKISAQGFALRFTAAASGQTGDIENWLDQSGSRYCGINCNGQLFIQLVDVNSANLYSNFSPNEGMLGYDYAAHTLKIYGSDSAWHTVGGPF